MERGPPVVGLRMDIGPLGNEVLDNIDVLVECRIEQRRSSSVVVLRIVVGSFSSLRYLTVSRARAPDAFSSSIPPR